MHIPNTSFPKQSNAEGKVAFKQRESCWRTLPGWSERTIDRRQSRTNNLESVTSATSETRSVNNLHADSVRVAGVKGGFNEIIEKEFSEHL